MKQTGSIPVATRGLLLRGAAVWNCQVKRSPSLKHLDKTHKGLKKWQSFKQKILSNKKLLFICYNKRINESWKKIVQVNCKTKQS